MRTIAAVLGSAVLGCSDPMGTVFLDFLAEPLEEEEVREWAVARTESGDHRVTVRRAVRVSGPCEDLDANLLRTADELTLRISGSAGRGLPGEDRMCGYTAVVHGLPSGRYTLRVVHTRTGPGPASEVVLDHPIHVR